MVTLGDTWGYAGSFAGQAAGVFYPRIQQCQLEEEHHRRRLVASKGLLQCQTSCACFRFCATVRAVHVAAKSFAVTQLVLAGFCALVAICG